MKNRPKKWTEAEHRQLRDTFRTMSATKAAAILGRSHESVKSRVQVLGLRKGRRPLSDEDLRIVTETYPHEPTKKIAERVGRTVDAVHRIAWKLGLHKTEVYLASPDACRLRRGDNVGAACRFLKGSVPRNKGLRRPGYSIGRGRMQQTTFKKGQRPRNWLPIGTVKMDCDGYLRRKIAEGIGGSGNARVWEFVHRRVWEDAHGPIPKGHRIWWKDRDHNNCALENLELLTDKEHMARTTVHNLPEPLKRVILLTGALKRKINTKRKKQNAEKQDVGSAAAPVCSARGAIG